MTITCPSCKKQYNVDSSKITEQGVKITCPACRHQFVVRRKQEEKKPQPPQTKTPPCIICGEPSTHVFKGPPPKPLCEHHFRIEMEKESRFFEKESEEAGADIPATDPSITPPRQVAAITPPAEDRGGVTSSPEDQVTRLSPPPPGAVQPEITQPPKPSPPGDLDTDQGPMPAAVSEPVFESFDDDFEFFEEGESPEAGQTPPPGPGRQAESVPMAAPHEFMQPDQGLTPAADEDESFPAGPTSQAEAQEWMPGEETPPPSPPSPGKDMEQLSPPSQPSDQIQPEETGSAPVSSEPPDPFSADALDLSSDGLEPGASPASEMDGTPPETEPLQAVGSIRPSEPSPEEGGLEGQVNGEGDFYLDGTPSEDHYSDLDDGMEGFEFEPSSPSSSSTSLDREMEESLELEGQKPRPMPTQPTGEAKKPAAATITARATRPRSTASALIVLLFLFTATAASTYFSVTGKTDPASGQKEQLEITVPAWEGRLSMAFQDEGPRFPMVSLPRLEIEQAPGKAEQSSQASVHYQQAASLMLKDTGSAYEEAVKEIEEAIRLDPGNPSLLALKVNLIAFRESLDDQGRTVLRSKDSKPALAAMGDKVEKAPLFLRAKAHVFLNDKKTAAAKALIEKYLKNHPGDAVASYLLGMTYLHQPRPDLEQATRYLEKAVRLEPYLVRAYWELAQIYCSVSRYDDAIDMYNQVLTRSPHRRGTAEAMEEALKEQSLSTPPKPGADIGQPSADAVTISVRPKQEPKGIQATGNAISDNILKVINEVEPQMRKLKLEPAKKPVTPVMPSRPRPPEEAPH